MIIETSDNRFYTVKPATASGLEHCYLGVEVRKVKGEWTERKRGTRAITQLIRKAATTVVEA